MTAVLDARVPELLDDLLRTVPPPPPARRIAARARSLDVSARLSVVLRVIGSATGLWITRHGLLTATPAGADIYGHVVRTDFALRELFPGGRLDGWFPGLGGGYRLFAVNGPGLALLAGIVRLGSLGRVETAQAFGLLGALSIAVLPWAVALLSRELGVSRLAAALHGLLALLVSFYGGGGLAGLYGPGLIAQSIALPLQVATLALVLRAVRHGGRRAIGVAAASVAGLALLHPISILVLALLAPLGLGRVWWGAPVRRLARAGAVAAWSVALAGFWLLPALRFRDRHGDATAWAIPPLPTRLGEVFRGDVLLPRPVAFAVAGAVVVTVVLALRRPSLWGRLVPCTGAMAFLTAAHLAVGHEVGPYDLRVMLPTRGLALAAILVLHPLAELLADLVVTLRRPLLTATHRPGGADGPGTSPAERRPSELDGPAERWPPARPAALAPRAPRAPRAGRAAAARPVPVASEQPNTRCAGSRWRGLAGAAVPVAVAVGLAVCVPWQLGGTLDPPQVAVPPSASFREAAAELHRRVPPMGRHLLVVPGVAGVGTDHPPRWLAAASETNSAHLYFWEATSENTAGVLAADLLWTIEPAAALDTLRRAGVTHVVTVDADQTAALAREDGYTAVWTTYDVTIFTVDAVPGRPAPGDLLQPAAEEPRALMLAATPVRQDPEHLAWEATAGIDLAVVAAVAYDPAWQASIDGSPVAVERSSDGFVQLDLPAGAHRVDLRFTATHPDPFGLVLTLAGLSALGLTLAPAMGEINRPPASRGGRRRQRRDGREPGSAAARGRGG